MPVDDVLTCRPRCHYTLGVLLSLKSLSFHQTPLSVSTIQVTNPRKDPLSEVIQTPSEVSDEPHYVQTSNVEAAVSLTKWLVSVCPV